MTFPTEPLLELDGFVLAGGKSTRMGRDKALLNFAGATFVERALESLKALADHPRIVGDRRDLAHLAPVIPDKYPQSGPLGGIHAALEASVHDWSLFLPVDLPLLPVSFLHYMASRVSLTGALATIPCVLGRPQPLVAVYHRSLLSGVRDSLESGDFGTLRAVKAAAGIAERECEIDFFQVESLVASRHIGAKNEDAESYRWFQNMNTPSELDDGASER